MLYLIKSYGPKGKLEPIYKVGYTTSLDNRLYNYFSHNPFVELISTRGGNEELEKLIHVCLYSLGYKFSKGGKLDEWFIGDLSKIQYIFHSTKRYLEKVIWRNRDKAFSVDSISNINSDSFKLLKRLYKENNYKINNSKYITKDNKVIKTDTSDLDILFYKLLLRNFPEDINIKDISSDISLGLEKEVQDFLDTKFYSTGLFHEKMRMYCEFMDKYQGNKEVSDLIYYKIKNSDFRKYYNFYGTPGCSAKKYQRENLEIGIINSSKELDISSIIYSKFKVGDRVIPGEVKVILQEIYENNGITSKAKATDLGRYFKLTRTKITLPNKKTKEGFKLDSL
jgi:hypothetical protein